MSFREPPIGSARVVERAADKLQSVAKQSQPPYEFGSGEQSRVTK